MKPYIDVTNETQKIETDKWNGKKLKLFIIEATDKFDEDKLNKVYDYIRELSGLPRLRDTCI